MPSAFREPKNLPDWIELDSHQRPRWLRRWRSGLTAGVMLLALTAVGVGMRTPAARPLVQAAPVSPAHTMIGNDCRQCHQESFQTAKRFLPWHANGRSVSDQACTHCHDGPAHNDRQLGDTHCADCHREHRGRRELARVHDNHCLRCHADLKANRTGRDVCPFDDVTGFPVRHPEFRLWRQGDVDPGKLHFNHQVHLKDGGVPHRIGDRIGARVLQCADCHRLDDAGRYMQPIRYEQHCAECHPLSIQLVGDFQGEKLQRAVEKFNHEPAPHREPAVVRALLRERLFRFADENSVVVGEDEENERRPLGLTRLRPVRGRQWQWANHRLDPVEKLLFPNVQQPKAERVLFDNGGGCRYCHVVARPREDRQGLTGGLPAFEPTNLRRRWFDHARFNHQSHRMLSCTECHDARNSRQTSDVLLPKMTTCAQCHNPQVGVPHDCVTCHNYHHRDHPETPKNRTIRGSLDAHNR